MSGWPSGEMRRVWIESKGQVTYGTDAIPEKKPGHVLVKVAYVGICGSDLSLFKGTSYYIDAGLNQYPVRWGHELSGVVEAVGDGVTNVAPGDRVLLEAFYTCGACEACKKGLLEACENKQELGLAGADGGASEYISVPARYCVKVPQNVSLLQAAMVEPTVPVMHAFSRTRVGFLDRIAIVGTGTLGLMAIQLGREVASSVDAIGIEDAGLALAKELGATQALKPDQVKPDSYDVIIEASGSPHAYEGLLSWVKPGGRLGLVGMANSPAPNFVPANIVMKNLEIHGCMDGIRFYQSTANLLSKGTLDTRVMLDKVFAAADAPAAFDRFAKRENLRPKVMLEFAGGE